MISAFQVATFQDFPTKSVYALLVFLLQATILGNIMPEILTY
jgi:hypothetical protein